MVETWGRDLYVYLDEVYRKKSRFAVIFVSRHYVDKPWTSHERQSVQARALTELEPYLLPVRLDDSELPGLRPTIGYVDARQVSKGRLVELILQKLGHTRDGPLRQPPGAVPRTLDAEYRLLAQRPPGWEYLLFAGVLAQGKAALEPKWRDHEMSYVRPAGLRLTDAEVADFISSAMDEAQVYSGNLGRTLDPHVQERAFGLPGVPGDPDRIKHMGQRLITMYEDFLDWSAHVRATRVSDQFQPLMQMTAKFLDDTLSQVRAFIDRLVAEMDRLPTLLAEGTDEPITLTMELVLSIDEERSRALHEELDRLSRRRKR